MIFWYLITFLFLRSSESSAMCKKNGDRPPRWKFSWSRFSNNHPTKVDFTAFGLQRDYPPEWEFNSYFFYLVKVLFGESVLRGVVDRGDSAALRWHPAQDWMGDAARPSRDDFRAKPLELLPRKMPKLSVNYSLKNKR